MEGDCDWLNGLYNSSQTYANVSFCILIFHKVGGVWSMLRSLVAFFFTAQTTSQIDLSIFVDRSERSEATLWASEKERNLCCEFTAECDVEIILKIGQYLVKLWSVMWWLISWRIRGTSSCRTSCTTGRLAEKRLGSDMTKAGCWKWSMT